MDIFSSHFYVGSTVYWSTASTLSKLNAYRSCFLYNYISVHPPRYIHRLECLGWLFEEVWLKYEHSAASLLCLCFLALQILISLLKVIQNMSNLKTNNCKLSEKYVILHILINKNMCFTLSNAAWDCYCCSVRIGGG